MNKIQILAIGLIGLSTLGYSQDTITIGKKDLLEKAAARNLQTQLAQKNYQVAKADYQQSNALFLPNITASYCYFYHQSVDGFWLQTQPRNTDCFRF